MSEQVTKIHITQYEKEVTNNPIDSKFNIKGSLIGRKFSPHLFSYKIRNLSRTKELEITIDDEGEIKKIELPEPIKKNLIKFFQERPDEKGYFDCASFVHYLYGIPYFGILYWSDWECEEYENDDNIEPGDSVFIFSESYPNENPSSMKHLAIYIGKGLYLSKFSDDGNLIFATLDEMKKGFGGEYVYKATPNLNL